MEAIHMKRSRPINKLLAAVAIVAAVAPWAMVQLAYAGPSEPTVPTEVQIEAGNKVFLVGHAVGVQIYTCNPVAGGYAWGPATPRADLYGDNGQLIATHFGGPTWQAMDGSYVKAKRIDGVVMDSSAIAWLKLQATSTGSGPDGGRLAGTTWIQRVATTGGLTPRAAECNADTAGTTREIDYTADYYFWKQTGD
jgi:Protein of unknown function (DUF3455)